MVMWAPLFMEAQGHPIKENIVCQDNQSAILQENNGEKSSGEHTQTLNMRHFMVTDQVEKGHSIVRCCPTDEMAGDFMTKGLQGIKFTKFWNRIMGHEQCVDITWNIVCPGSSVKRQCDTRECCTAACLVSGGSTQVKRCTAGVCWMEFRNEVELHLMEWGIGMPDSQRNK